MASSTLNHTPSELEALTQARRTMKVARRVVIKASTPVVTHVDNNVALGRLGTLVEQIAQLRRQGREVVVVSSGAIATGTMSMRKSMTLNSTVQETMSGSKANVAPPAPCAAVGQALLMNLCALLTRPPFTSRAP